MIRTSLQECRGREKITWNRGIQSLFISLPTGWSHCNSSKKYFLIITFQANQFATRSVKYLISCNYFILLHSYLLNFKFHRIYILLDPYYGEYLFKIELNDLLSFDKGWPITGLEFNNLFSSTLKPEMGTGFFKNPFNPNPITL